MFLAAAVRHAHAQTASGPVAAPANGAAADNGAGAIAPVTTAPLPPPVIPPVAQQENAAPPPLPPGMQSITQIPPATPSPVPMPTVTIPTIETGLPTAPPPSLSLDQVLSRVLSTNPTILLSEQRLALAHAEIQQGESTGLPHVNLNVADTYYGAPTDAGPSSVEAPSSNFTTTIPSVVDAAQGQTFTGGGGTLGTTTTQISSSSGGTGASATTPTSGATVTPVSPSNPAATPTTTNNTGVTGTGSTSPIAGGAGGNGSGTTPAPQAARPGAIAPGSDPLLQQYEAAMQQQTTEQPLQEGPNAAGNGNGSNNKTWHNAYGGGISLSQLVDVFGLVGTGVGVLKENEHFYQIDLTREMNEETLTVKNTFFAVINAQNDVASAQEQVTNATATLNTATAQYSAGVVPQFDVVSAQTQLSTAQSSLLSAQNELNTQMANLDNLMGLPTGTEFTLVSPALPTLPATYNEPAEISKAYDARPEMQQVLLDEDIAKKMVRLAEAGYLPTFAVGADVDYDGQVASAGTSHYSEEVTAQMTFPLYDGGQTASQVSQAKINLKSQQVTETQLRQNIALEVEAALLNLQNATSLVQADENTVNQSRESLRLAQISYRAGVGTLLDVENAQAEVASSEENLSQAEFQLETSYAALVRAQGGR